MVWGPGRGALVSLGLWELSGGRLSTTLVNRMEERLIANLPTDEVGFAQGGLKLMGFVFTLLTLNAALFKGAMSLRSG